MAEPILIAHVIHRLDFGGLENGLVNLINRLPDKKYRHAIICLTDYTDFSKRIEKNVELVALHKQPGKDIGLYFRLWKAIRKLKPDVVHTRNLSSLEAQLPAFFAGVKYRIHGEHGWDIYDLDGQSWKYRALKKFFRPLIHRYIVLSLDLKNYLVNTIKVKEKKITHICNGVDSERFTAHLNSGINHFSDDDSQLIIIGTVGRLEAVKDQANLACAFAELISKKPEFRKNVRMVIIGDGSERNNIEAIINQHNLSDLVWLAGTRSDIPEMLNYLDIFVLPSLAEGISNTILEAMSCGLPVVATRVGGNPELIAEGETGYTVPASNPKAIADVLINYIESPDLIKNHGENARNRIEKSFSINVMVNNYQTIYDNQINN